MVCGDDCVHVSGKYDCSYIYIYMCVCIHAYIYIYIHIWLCRKYTWVYCLLAYMTMLYTYIDYAVRGYAIHIHWLCCTWLRYTHTSTMLYKHALCQTCVYSYKIEMYMYIHMCTYINTDIPVQSFQWAYHRVFQTILQICEPPLRTKGPQKNVSMCDSAKTCLCIHISEKCLCVHPRKYLDLAMLHLHGLRLAMHVHWLRTGFALFRLHWLRIW